MWLEISNTLADIRFLLAQARSYKALEPTSPESTRRSEQLKYYAHFAKMHCLNLSVFELVKVQDLVVRLLFENFGGTLIDVDQTKEDWEKKLTLAKAKDGLAKWLENGDLASAEYDKIVAALDLPQESEHQEVVVNYRNRVTHRLLPSVDYPELYTQLEDRIGKPIFGANGKEKGREFFMGAGSTKPEFYFSEIYPALLDYLKQVIKMLSSLKCIPRLA